MNELKCVIQIQFTLHTRNAYSTESLFGEFFVHCSFKSKLSQCLHSDHTVHYIFVSFVETEWGKYVYRNTKCLESKINP